MKRVFFTALIILLLGKFAGYSQQIPEGAIMLDENTIVKDESGKVVEMAKLMGYLDSGDWMMEPVNNEDGELLYLQLRKATDEEKTMMAKMPKPGSASSLLGEKAPEFEITDINGNVISSENTKGKVVVLNFWFTTCKPCIAEIPGLNEVYEKYNNDTNVVFAAITFEPQEKVEKFLKDNPLKYPMVVNARELCNLFGVNGFPTNVVIYREGNYFDYISGGSPRIGHAISNSIQNALDNKEPMSVPTQAKGNIIDPKSTFKLESGEVVPFEKVIGLLDTNKYDILPKKDADGEEYFLLKEK